jgi:hypothetical protein
MRRRWCAPKPCRPRCGSNRADPPRLVRLWAVPPRGDAVRPRRQSFVPGLEPGLHGNRQDVCRGSWMAGTSPATNEHVKRLSESEHLVFGGCE